MEIAIIVVASVATALVIWASSYYVGKIDQKNQDLQTQISYTREELAQKRSIESENKIIRAEIRRLKEELARANTLEKHIVASSSTETETN